jgi:hypothetical protein
LKSLTLFVGLIYLNSLLLMYNRFRYSIMELRHSLPKFLRCVDWSSATHAEETVKVSAVI